MLDVIYEVSYWYRQSCDTVIKCYDVNTSFSRQFSLEMYEIYS